jgi:hypothetical protein
MRMLASVSMPRGRGIRHSKAKGSEKTPAHGELAFRTLIQDVLKRYSRILTNQNVGASRTASDPAASFLSAAVFFRHPIAFCQCA